MAELAERAEQADAVPPHLRGPGAARKRSKSSASPKCAGDREDVAGELRAEPLAVLEPGDREPLRLGLQRGLVALARHERDQSVAQEPRIVVLPGLWR